MNSCRFTHDHFDPGYNSFYRCKQVARYTGNTNKLNSNCLLLKPWIVVFAAPTHSGLRSRTIKIRLQRCDTRRCQCAYSVGEARNLSKLSGENVNGSSVAIFKVRLGAKFPLTHLLRPRTCSITFLVVSSNFYCILDNR